MERPSAASASWETLPDKMWHLRARHPPHQQCPPAAPRAGGFGHPSTALTPAGVAPPLFICPQDLQKASADQPGLGHCTRGWSGLAEAGGNQRPPGAHLKPKVGLQHPSLDVLATRGGRLNGIQWTHLHCVKCCLLAKLLLLLFSAKSAIPR